MGTIRRESGYRNKLSRCRSGYYSSCGQGWDSVAGLFYWYRSFVSGDDWVEKPVRIFFLISSLNWLFPSNRGIGRQWIRASALRKKTGFALYLAQGHAVVEDIERFEYLDHRGLPWSVFRSRSGSGPWTVRIYELCGKSIHGDESFSWMVQRSSLELYSRLSNPFPLVDCGFSSIDC